MRCPFCHSADTSVIDSRLIDEGDGVRRRRKCNTCDERYTTYERAELSLPRVAKSNDERVSFDESKLRKGLQLALEKRPVGAAEIEAALNNILRRARGAGEGEVLGVDDLGDGEVAGHRDRQGQVEGRADGD